MITPLRAPIVRMGNSQGIRIPKLLIDRLGFAQGVEMEVQEDRLILRSLGSPRSEWDKRFEAADEPNGLLLEEEALLLTEWEESEWLW